MKNKGHFFEPRNTQNSLNRTRDREVGVCMDSPSDPRLRRTLHTCGIQGYPSPETVPQTSLRRRLRLGYDQTAQARSRHGGVPLKNTMGLQYLDQAVRLWARRDLRSNLFEKQVLIEAHPAGVCLTDRRASVRVRRPCKPLQTILLSQYFRVVSCGSWLRYFFT
jgi:hypothetical protein